MGEIHFNKFNTNNIAPYLAKMILVKDDENNIIGKIPLGNYKPEYGERLYRFAVLSDIHFNERDGEVITNITEKQDAFNDFRRALAFIDTKPEKDIDNIEFTCICGDVSTDWGTGRDSIYQSYKDEINKSSKPVYTCTGNHDTAVLKDWNDLSWDEGKDWNYFTGMNSNRLKPYVDEGLERYHDHFTRTYTVNGLEKKDNFYFFSMRRFSLGTQGEPFKDEDITALEKYLEAHKNERTFIFTHCPFPMRAGVFAHRYNNGFYWIGGEILKRLIDLTYKYKNTIWFSGHSHYQWDCQGFKTLYHSGNDNDVYNWKENNYDANIWPANIDHNRECGWAVHIPSCSGVRPIESGSNGQHGVQDWTENNKIFKTMNETGQSGYKVYNTSEFAIIDVYENYIDFRGVTLKGQESSSVPGQLCYNPIAQYRLDTTIKVNPEKYASYNLSLLTLNDIKNLNSGQSICLTSVSTNGSHIGSIDNEFKNALIHNSFKAQKSGISELYNDMYVAIDICGTDVDGDITNTSSKQYKYHHNNECQMYAEMRDLVNMRPKQFTFELYKEGDYFYIKNKYGKYLSVDDSDFDSEIDEFEMLYWSNNINDRVLFEAVDGNNLSSENKSNSCLVNQTANNNLIKLKVKDIDAYINIDDISYIKTGTSGKMLMYMYKVEHKA